MVVIGRGKNNKAISSMSVICYVGWSLHYFPHSLILNKDTQLYKVLGVTYWLYLLVNIQYSSIDMVALYTALKRKAILLANDFRFIGE